MEFSCTLDPFEIKLVSWNFSPQLRPSDGDKNGVRYWTLIKIAVHTKIHAGLCEKSNDRRSTTKKKTVSKKQYLANHREFSY